MKKLISLILAAVLTAFAAAPALAETDAVTRDGVGMSIAGFSTRDLNGNAVTDAILDDAVVTVINEWATWCNPCLSEMPYFQQMHEHYGATPEADVQIIGAVYVSGSCTAASAKQYLENNGYTWMNIIEDQIIENVFMATDSIPSTLIVDRHGVVRAHHVGSFSSPVQLQDFIDEWYDILAAEEAEPAVPGDIDGSGGVTVTDAVLALRMVMGIIPLSNLSAADMNENGAVDMTDAITILRLTMGF